MPAVAAHARAVGRTAFSVIRDWVREVPEPVIGLHLGAPEVPPPVQVTSAVEQAISLGRTGYAPDRGLPQLVEAIATKLAGKNCINADPEQIVVTAGATQGLHLALTAVLNRGQEVLVPDPGWPVYSETVRMLGGRPVPYPMFPRDPFPSVISSMIARIGPATRAIVINSPSNPTGTVLTESSLELVVDIARRHDLWIVSDECYESFTFESGHVSPGALAAGNVISCFSFSKTFAMPGMRVGYLVAPRSLADVCVRLQAASVCCVSTPAQYGALAGLEGSSRAVSDMKCDYLRRRNAATRFLRDAEISHVVPQGAFYVFARVMTPGRRRRSEGDWEWAARLLNSHRVAVMPGSGFGSLGDGYVRIALTADDEKLTEGLRRVAMAYHTA
ncbi:pyridoxal phosphate-dependent aminotransferase [Streptomyces rectiverticillatus]|uniref:pyridoxal phosphate-dependent aminotransferase n=1 Tax=Streptomyces rectiverticillatus TaxID=173860 RepID=UPI0015C2F57D|nr:pyridoxal phosphate-dependent aminotransferase [Streptomyces rectiverticillatus]QLE74605.1 pyridoxal phosphate-dependent aminotransferase [Streptomyces rectiverticillatus]